MKNYIKMASISLAVFFGISTGNFADDTDRDPYDNGHKVYCTAWGGLYDSTGKSLTDSTAEEPKDKAFLLATIGGCAWSGTKMIGNAGLYMASNVANNLGRYSVAYGASYLGVEMLMEGTALGMYYGAYAIGAVSIAGPGAGAAAGLAAYTMTTMALKGLHMIPGMHGALAATYTPVVRGFTDMAIDHGPAAVGAALSAGYSATKAAASFAQSSFSSLSQYLYAW